MERKKRITAALAASCICLLAAKPLAPDFTVKDSGGSDLRLSAYKGKVVLLNFWATYCVPCRTEIPWFIEFDKAYRDKGLVVVGISMDEEWADVKKFVGEKRIDYKIGLGNEDLAKKYGGLDALPETYIIDREGRVAAHHIGLAPKADVEKEITQVLGK
jgi:thiol-disulfide isomerase/thioredoxin